MRIRFRQPTPSENPEFPFHPGQEIEVPELPAYLQRWLELGHLDILAEAAAAEETATLDAEDAPETAVAARAPRRRGGSR